MKQLLIVYGAVALLCAVCVVVIWKTRLWQGSDEPYSFPGQDWNPEKEFSEVHSTPKLTVTTTKEMCATEWTLTTPLIGRIILRNHYSPICVHQYGVQGSFLMEVKSSTSGGTTLETIIIPFYKGRGCGLIAGNFSSGSTVTLAFQGCSSGGTTIRIVEPECLPGKMTATNNSNSVLQVSCLENGPLNFDTSVIVLSKPVTVSDVQWKKTQTPVLFTHSSSKTHDAPNKALLTVTNSVIDRSNVWFAFHASSSHSPSLLKIVNSSVVLQNAHFVGSGKDNIIASFEGSRVQISKSEFASQGTVTQLHFIRTYAVLYEVNSLVDCSASGHMDSRSQHGFNFRFDRYLYPVLRPVIWRSSIANWCGKSIAYVDSPYRLRLFETTIEQPQNEDGVASFFLHDVIMLTPESMTHAHSQIQSKAARSHEVWYAPSGNRLNSSEFKRYSTSGFRETFCTASKPSTEFSEALEWLSGIVCSVDITSSTFTSKRYEACPQEDPNSRPKVGSQHIAYLATLNGFHVLVRYPKKGQPRPLADMETLIHPSMGFRIGVCKTISGRLGEIFRIVRGSSLSRPKRNLPVKMIYNIALDMSEAFAYLHHGRPQGGKAHGDFAVGYFQKSSNPPRIKNMAVNFDQQMTMLFDFDSTFRKRGAVYSWDFRGTMRKDVQGLGFAFWHLVGIQVTKENVSPQDSLKLVNKCDSSVRPLCQVAAKCMNSSSQSSFDTIAIFNEIVDGIPSKLK